MNHSFTQKDRYMQNTDVVAQSARATQRANILPELGVVFCILVLRSAELKEWRRRLPRIDEIAQLRDAH